MEQLKWLSAIEHKLQPAQIVPSGQAAHGAMHTSLPYASSGVHDATVDVRACKRGSRRCKDGKALPARLQVSDAAQVASRPSGGRPEPSTRTDSESFSDSIPSCTCSGNISTAATVLARLGSAVSVDSSSKIAAALQSRRSCMAPRESGEDPSTTAVGAPSGRARDAAPAAAEPMRVTRVVETTPNSTAAARANSRCQRVALEPSSAITAGIQEPYHSDTCAVGTTSNTAAAVRARAHNAHARCQRAAPEPSSDMAGIDHFTHMSTDMRTKHAGAPKPSMNVARTRVQQQ